MEGLPFALILVGDNCDFLNRKKEKKVDKLIKTIHKIIILKLF